eukprot:c21337_g1_i1 orf=1-813(+)
MVSLIIPTRVLGRHTLCLRRTGSLGNPTGPTREFLGQGCWKCVPRYRETLCLRGTKHLGNLAGRTLLSQGCWKCLPPYRSPPWVLSSHRQCKANPFRQAAIFSAPFLCMEHRFSLVGVSTNASSPVASGDGDVAASLEAPAMGSSCRESQQAGPSFAQYVVIRKDLVDSLKWPLGSVIAQACHAAVAAVWLHRDDSETRDYCLHLDNMTTVTLEVKGEAQLLNLAQKLEAGGVLHKLWIEQPENFPTCLATKPYSKAQVSHFFRKLKLCK